MLSLAASRRRRSVKIIVKTYATSLAEDITRKKVETYATSLAGDIARKICPSELVEDGVVKKTIVKIYATSLAGDIARKINLLDAIGAWAIVQSQAFVSAYPLYLCTCMQQELHTRTQVPLLCGLCWAVK